MLIPDLSRIVGTRNRIIHVYEAVDQLILWDSINNDLPGLRSSLLAALGKDPPMP
ncbi:HepT-like ribonuclease domain-containing protein [Cyanobium sp. Copco_Reservoir_LC18]|uniref:HepT-like ribonuclease domain-containing protein n=1 Tax=Cyanobium sp. Copco_Reservoir_LC18 TaxID=1328305 RepID=UPI00135B0865